MSFKYSKKKEIFQIGFIIININSSFLENKKDFFLDYQLTKSRYEN